MPTHRLRWCRSRFLGRYQSKADILLSTPPILLFSRFARHAQAEASSDMHACVPIIVRTHFAISMRGARPVIISIRTLRSCCRCRRWCEPEAGASTPCSVYFRPRLVIIATTVLASLVLRLRNRNAVFSSYVGGRASRCNTAVMRESPIGKYSHPCSGVCSHGCFPQRRNHDDRASLPTRARSLFVNEAVRCS